MRSFLAPIRGPLTLDGTRSYLVGDDPVAIIDPGPRIESHISALAKAVRTASEVVILLTHAHDDHAAASARLAHRTGGSVFGPGGDHDLGEGQVIATSGGDLVAVATPGHARRHFCFHHPDTASIFVGDLLMGEGDTTWIGEYLGAVADYLRSLDRLDALAPRTLHPAHGPPHPRPGGDHRPLPRPPAGAYRTGAPRRRSGTCGRPRHRPARLRTPSRRRSAPWPRPAWTRFWATFRARSSFPAVCTPGEA